MTTPIKLVAFDVVGHPVTQGSKRAWVNRATGRAMMVEDRNVELTSWRREVTNAAANALHREGIKAPTSAAVTILLTFFFFRPAGHYGTGRNHRQLKPGAPDYPTSKAGQGDFDKLTRAVCDALTDARVWVDDAQVVSATIHKRYVDRFTEREGVSVVVGTMPIIERTAPGQEGLFT